MTTPTVRDLEIEVALTDIRVHALSFHLSADAVRRYYEMGFAAGAIARQLNDADHGDNSLVDQNGEPIAMTKR